MAARLRYATLFSLAAFLFLAACERPDTSDSQFLQLTTDTACDREAGCVAARDGISVHFFIDPHARALQPFSVRARVHDDAPVSDISVEFAMVEMQMGLNSYRLVLGSDNIWRADVTLPVCMSGRSDWVAEFELLSNERRVRFRAPFSLGK